MIPLIIRLMVRVDLTPSESEGPACAVVEFDRDFVKQLLARRRAFEVLRAADAKLVSLSFAEAPWWFTAPVNRKAPELTAAMYALDTACGNSIDRSDSIEVSLDPRDVDELGEFGEGPSCAMELEQCEVDGKGIVFTAWIEDTDDRAMTHPIEWATIESIRDRLGGG